MNEMFDPSSYTGFINTTSPLLTSAWTLQDLAASPTPYLPSHWYRPTPPPAYSVHPVSVREF